MQLDTFLDISIGYVGHFFQDVFSLFFLLFSSSVFDLIIIDFDLPCPWAINFSSKMIVDTSVRY